MNSEKNRRFTRQYSKSKLLYRVIWEYFGLILFKISPNRLFRFRNFLLRIFGAQIGENVRIYNSVKIHFPCNLIIKEGVAIGSKVEIKNHKILVIGNYSTISQRTSIIDSTHDFKKPNFPLLSKSISIGDDVWIAQEAFIGPGVILSNQVVIGSRAVCFKSLAKGIYVGNPIKKIK